MRKTLLTCALLSLTLCACVTRPVLNAPPASCAGLIPQAWREPTPATPIPPARTARVVPADASPVVRVQARLDDALDALRDYAGAFVAESGQREKADGRTAAVIGIVSECERLVNAARQ